MSKATKVYYALSCKSSNAALSGSVDDASEAQVDDKCNRNEIPKRISAITIADSCRNYNIRANLKLEPVLKKI